MRQQFGVGLRSCHINHVLETKPAVDFFEVQADDYLDIGGAPLENLEKIREDYPIVLHGVGLSIGSVDGIDELYLAKIAALIRRLEPRWYSEHLCWNRAGQQYLPDLLPLPYTQEAARCVSQNVERVQAALSQPLLIENVSSYLSYQHSEMTEWEFLSVIANRTDCQLLLDVNNVFVSASNHGFDPLQYIQSIPAERVRQYHLAGFSNQETHLLDTHGASVDAQVWKLYQQTLEQIGPRPLVLEWDNAIPEFSVLEAEIEKAQQCFRLPCLNPVVVKVPQIPVSIETPAYPLAALEADFLAAVQAGLGKPLATSLTAVLKPTVNLSVLAQVDIYRGSIEQGLVKALDATFAKSASLVGHACFTALAERYVSVALACGQTYDSLDAYFTDFPSFIANFKQVAEQVPYLSDVARLELAWHQAFRLQQEAGFDAEAFAKLTESAKQAVRLQLHPHSSLLHSPYRLLAIWSLCEAPELESEPLVSDGESYLLVTRIGETQSIISISAEQYACLSVCAERLSLAQACERLLADGINLAENLSELIQNGWIGIHALD